MSTVLVVDDEANIRSTLETTFSLDGYDVCSAANGREALERIRKGGVDLVVLDMQMPVMDGMAALRALREEGHEIPVLFLTAHGSIDAAVEAVKLGAFDFIEKPPKADRILLAARNALRQASLVEENRELREYVDRQYDMIGTSAPMLELFEQIRRTAPTEARVLILGENGTGKELIARALHAHSARAARPFVRVNCAAVPRELFESELFGHERGAFTGATSRRRGKFVRADRGTLFLDEVAEIPAALQAKLLRALEAGEIEPVGAEREVKVDVRVLAATNRDLATAVERDEFRRDLYYRLQVVQLSAPALRERREDIPLLAAHFFERFVAENGRTCRLDEAAMTRLGKHEWPGNVRELRNTIERLVILTRGDRIGGEDVERALAGTPGSAPAAGVPALAGSLRETMRVVERDLLVATLERCRWRMTATAELLGLERSHLYKKLRALGIERPD